MTDSTDQWRMEVATALGRIEEKQLASTEARRTTDHKLDTVIAELRLTGQGVITAQQGVAALQVLVAGHELRIKAVEGAPWRLARRGLAAIGVVVVSIWGLASETASHVFALWISAGAKH